MGNSKSGPRVESAYQPGPGAGTGPRVHTELLPASARLPPKPRNATRSTSVVFRDLNIDTPVHKSNSEPRGAPNFSMPVSSASPNRRRRRRRISSVKKDEQLLDSLKALAQIEEALQSSDATKASKQAQNFVKLRLFLQSKALRNLVSQHAEISKLQETYEHLRRQDNDSDTELASYVEQFGMKTTEERSGRGSVTLGHTVKAVTAAKKWITLVSHSTSFRSSQSVIVRMCDLPATDLAKLQQYENQMQNWDFDMIEFNQFTAGNALLAFGVSAFTMHDLTKVCNVRPGVLVNFLSAIQDGYDAQLSYHNAIHGADVAHAVNAFIINDLVDSLAMRPLEVLSMLVAGLVHDYKHPGVNNKFLVATRHEYAITYNDKSVLEQMHCAETFRLCASKSQCNIFAAMSDASAKAARALIITSVLGTDMAHHFKKLAEFNANVVAEVKALEAGTASSTPKSGGGAVLLNLEQRNAVLNMALHVADVSNPMKSLDVYKKWTYRVMDEFFGQGDAEVAAGNEISAFMDRHNPQPVKCQQGFIKFIVEPLYKSWAHVVPSLATQFTTNLATNREWLETEGCLADLPLVAQLSRYEQENRGGAKRQDVDAARYMPSLESAASMSTVQHSSPPPLRAPVVLTRPPKEHPSDIDAIARPQGLLTPLPGMPTAGIPHSDEE